MVSLSPGPGDALALTGKAELATARRTVGEAAATFLGPDRGDDVEVCVSELVTNALEHGDGTGAVLTYETAADAFVISVSNASAEMVGRPTEVRVHQRAGRGLHIVEAMADHLDIQRTAGTVVVTCRFTR